jgi:hypothetical protein
MGQRDNETPDANPCSSLFHCDFTGGNLVGFRSVQPILQLAQDIRPALERAQKKAECFPF